MGASGDSLEYSLEENIEDAARESFSSRKRDHGEPLRDPAKLKELQDRFMGFGKRQELPTQEPLTEAEKKVLRRLPRLDLRPAPKVGGES